MKMRAIDVMMLEGAGLIDDEIEVAQAMADASRAFQAGRYGPDAPESNAFRAGWKAATDRLVKSAEARKAREQRAKVAEGHQSPEAYCADGQPCRREVEWGHPCDRDEIGQYECELETQSRT